MKQEYKNSYLSKNVCVFTECIRKHLNLPNLFNQNKLCKECLKQANKKKFISCFKIFVLFFIFDIKLSNSISL